MIKVKLLHDDAKKPVRGSEGAAGLDLHTIESVDLNPGERVMLRTGVSMKIPYGFVGLIWPRSKLSAKLGVNTLAGVVDSDYRGEVMIALINHSDETVEIWKGDKVVQMLIQPIWMGDVQVVESLDRTDRGSTGISCTDMRLK